MYYVYILSSATNYTLYIGVTGDLLRRVYQHKHNLDPDSFTAKYAVHKLVYFEQTNDVRSALEREKQLKGWRRSKKNALIETMNPQWKDLYPDLWDNPSLSSAPLCHPDHATVLLLVILSGAQRSRRIRLPLCHPERSAAQSKDP